MPKAAKQEFTIIYSLKLRKQMDREDAEGGFAGMTVYDLADLEVSEARRKEVLQDLIEKATLGVKVIDNNDNRYTQCEVFLGEESTLFDEEIAEDDNETPQLSVN